jgi:peptide-methionine (R)-S-oxide reductase
MKIASLWIAAALALTGALGALAYSQTRVTGVGPAGFDLEALRRAVMDFGATEQPFNNAYWDHDEPGIYVEARTGEPLFASSDKFDSGTGWPSFTRPIDSHNITTRADRSLGMARTEVRSRQGGAHLGHVFNDGPRDRGGQRWCMNSCAMRFIPRDRMAAEGYGEYLPLVDDAPAG